MFSVRCSIVFPFFGNNTRRNSNRRKLLTLCFLCFVWLNCGMNDSLMNSCWTSGVFGLPKIGNFILLQEVILNLQTLSFQNYIIGHKPLRNPFMWIHYLCWTQRILNWLFGTFPLYFKKFQGLSKPKIVALCYFDQDELWIQNFTRF